MQEPFIKRAGYNATPKKPEEDYQEESRPASQDVAKKGAVDQLREEATPSNEENSELRERLERERQERVMKKELKDFARKQSDPANNARDTNPRRREESVTRTSKQLEAPKASVTQVSETSSPANGEGIDCWVYKDGVIGSLKFITEGSFTPLQ